MRDIRNLATVCAVLVCGCSAQPSGTSPPTEAQRPLEIVGKAWLSTDPSAAPGTIRIFLADGTLVMDSCFETYRLARWKAIDDRRIAWTEDSASIEAQVSRVTGEQLQLRVQLAGEVKEETYRLAPVPTVCPDMPRGR
jgi:hypothetical protein